jgi:hypothetical protein
MRLLICRKGYETLNWSTWKNQPKNKIARKYYE